MNRLLLRSTRTNAKLNGAIRRFGAGQPESQSMKAKLFENSHYEGWEPIIYTTYAVATAIIVFGVGNKPDTDIKSWAQGEAIARMKLKESGAVEKFEFGIHYDTDEKYQFDDKANPLDPFKQEDDDDDDDEEDDDE